MSESPQQPPKPAPTVEDPRMDAAQQSLADALRVSFTVLKFVMVILVIIYIFSGIFRVDEQNRAVRLRFGEPVGQSEYGSGWHFGLPYPLEEVIQVPKNTQKLRIDKAFWYDNPNNSTPEQLAFQPIDPLKDGFLITGDTNIIHVQFELSYVISDIALYIENVGTLEKAEQLLLTAAQRGMLHAVAAVTIDAIVNQGQYPTEDVKVKTQAVLDNLQTGLQIQQVLIDREKQSMPPAVRNAYVEVTNAQADKATAIESARQEFDKQLIDTAGAAYDELYRMIQAYDDALQREDQELARAIRQEIDQSFTSKRLANDALDPAMAQYIDAAGSKAEGEDPAYDQARSAVIEALSIASATAPEDRTGPIISGNASKSISNAVAYQTDVVKLAEQRLDRFNSYIHDYRKHPLLISQTLWQQTRGEVMSGMVETIYTPTGDLRIGVGRDPKIVQEMMANELQQSRERAQREEAEQRR